MKEAAMRLQAQNPRQRRDFDELKNLISQELTSRGIAGDFDVADFDNKTDVFYVRLRGGAVEAVECTSKMFAVLDRIPDSQRLLH
jgi:hypothetical protein